MNQREVNRVVGEIREHIAAVEEATEKSTGWRIEIREIELAVLLIAPMLDSQEIELLAKIAGRWSWYIRPAESGVNLVFVIW